MGAALDTCGENWFYEFINSLAVSELFLGRPFFIPKPLLGFSGAAFLF